MSTEADTPWAAGGRQRLSSALFGVVSCLAVAAVVFSSWRRLFFGVDLQNESFYLLVPWRWALGDRPFVDEENLAQISAFIAYPFVKAFAVVRDYDVTGLVLYARHLYFLLMVCIALVVFVALRRLLRWPLALAVAAAIIAFAIGQTPRLSHGAVGVALLTLGSALGLWVVMDWGGVRRWAFGSGVAFGLAVIAYPTLLFIMPFYAVLLAFALGRRSVAALAEFAFAHPPDPPGPPTGPLAWRALSFWVLGGAAVLVPFGLIVLSFGVHNLKRCWGYSMGVAQSLHQLGGAAKAVSVAQDFWRFMWSGPYLVVAALAICLMYTRWPRAGRALLVVLPFAVWTAGQRHMHGSGGSVILYGFVAPYLLLFLPRERRQAGARLLLWVWAPSVAAAAMVSFTSAAGYEASPVGLLPALLVSGVFVAWSLEAVTRPATEVDVEAPAPRRGAVGRPRTGSWLALAVLVAVLGVVVLPQAEFQQGDVRGRALRSTFSTGPWWGIDGTPERRRLMDGFAADLVAHIRPGDEMLVFFKGSGYYLYWNGPIACNTYFLWPTADGRLPRSTTSYYRRHRLVPTFVVHLAPTRGMSDADLTKACGGLDYSPTLVRPLFTVYRKPVYESTAEVLARLPRLGPR